MKDALIVVDVQNDFCPGGALAVAAGDQVVPVINASRTAFDLVVFTQDWHPASHGSFAANHAGRKPGEVIRFNGLQQILWPVHCVQDTAGAAFHTGLDIRPGDPVFRKGMDPQVDSYSGFFDNGRRQDTGLGAFLMERGVTDVAVCGLATDYCVKFTALDAASLGFRVRLLAEACRGVELSHGDVDRALADMQRAGIRLDTARAAAS